MLGKPDKKQAHSRPAPPPQGVDLGLSGLIEGERSISWQGYLESLASRRTDGAVPPLRSGREGVQEGKPGAFAELARKGAWGQLAKLSEEHTSNAELSNGAGASLWWVRAQLELGQMPSTILAAPLEAAVEKLPADSSEGGGASSLKELAEGLLVEVGERLVSAGEGELAVTILERAWGLNRQHADKLRGVLLEELSRLQSSARGRKRGDYIEQLESLLGEVKVNEVPQTLVASLGFSESLPKPSRPWAIMFIWLCSFLLVLATAWGGVVLARAHFFSPFSGDASAATSELLKERTYASLEPPSLSLPQHQPITAVGLAKLDGLLAKLGERRTGFDNEGSAVAVSQGTNSQPVAISTKGPAEPESVRRLREGEGPGSLEDEAVQRIRERREPIVRGQSREDPIVGEPLERNRGRRIAGAVVYEAIRPISVLAAPSSNALEVGRLDAGDYVDVVEVLGSWAKLLSQAQREGYAPLSSLRLVGGEDGFRRDRERVRRDG